LTGALWPQESVDLVCLRHAESENVVAGASGALPLSPLTARGRQQAAEAAAAPGLAGVRCIYTSTALRARQTAQILACSLEVDVLPLPELVEIGIGDQEGSVEAVLRRETADVLQAWVVAGDLDRRVGNGESGHEVLARVRAALDAIAAENPGKKVALVGHVGSLTLGLSVVCGLGGTVWGAPLPPAQPFSVHGAGDRWHCRRWPGGLSATS
jgi:alpha-ribazole phosphatase/probable phosphoglycerate mutase